MSTYKEAGSISRRNHHTWKTIMKFVEVDVSGVETWAMHPNITLICCTRFQSSREASDQREGLKDKGHWVPSAGFQAISCHLFISLCKYAYIPTPL